MSPDSGASNKLLEIWSHKPEGMAIEQSVGGAMGRTYQFWTEKPASWMTSHARYSSACPLPYVTVNSLLALANVDVDDKSKA
jgi:hypothetical protein